MSDIALTFDPISLLFDIGFTLVVDDVDMDTTLKTAVLISLFSDKRASKDDILPYPGAGLRGWWGDNFSDIEGDQIGSKLWLFEREIINQDTINGLKDAAKESLQWFIDDKIASKIEIETEILAMASVDDTIAMKISIFKPDGTIEEINFENVWNDL